MARASAGLALLAISAGATLLAGGCGKARTEMPIVVPLYGEGLPNVIAHQYFVVMPDGTTEDLLARTEKQVQDLGGQALQHYASVFTGFLASLSDDVLHQIRRNPNIGYIETDRTLTATGVQTCTTPWGVDRLDQGERPLDRVFAYDKTGKNVLVHVLDTGIDGTDPEFSPGRVQPGINALDKSNDALDRHGHGTHLAGIIGGKTMGVAKEAKLVPIKVLDDKSGCAEPPKGSISALLAGIDWSIAQQAMSPAHRVLLLACEEGGGIGADAVSLVTGISAAIKNNMVVVVSAGNKNADVDGKAYVCADLKDPKLSDPKYAPYRNRIVVGATTESDQRWTEANVGSNYGPCVDLFAPGGDIPSLASQAGCYQNGRAVLSGTSQAAAHVAGIAALMLEATAGTIDPEQIKKNIVSSARSGVLGDIGAGSKNLLAQNPMNKGYSLPSGAAADADGVNDGLKPCEGATCGFCADDGTSCAKGLGCGDGLQCAQGKCERCGANDEPCCEGQCAKPFGCSKAKGVCTCGTLGERCCNLQCNGPDLACNQTTDVCELCGANAQLCCLGDRCSSNNLVCSPANTPDSKCTPCGTQGAICCAGGTCLTADLACNLTAKQCVTCGGSGQPCCGVQCSGALICSGGKCVDCGGSGQPCCGVQCSGTLICSGGQCVACGGDMAPCCAGNTCTGALDCVGGMCLDYCGSPGQQCCAGQTPCDAGMDCTSGKCAGLCEVRCTKGGSYMYSELPRLSAGDCATWANVACNYKGSPASRIRYNGILVGGSGVCGGLNEPLCEVSPGCNPGYHEYKSYPNEKLGSPPNVAIHPSDQFCAP